jgi:ketohexokinase
VPKYPIEDQKLRATDHARRRGGNCANTLEVLSQLVFLLDKHDAEVPTQLLSQESRLHLLTVLPNEESAATKFIRGSLNGVDVSSCIFRSESTEAAASYILQNAQNYSRTIISHNSLPEMTTQEFMDKAAELSQPDYGQGGWYHFEGRVPEITVQCVEYMRSALKQRGWKISVECEKPERGGLVEAAKIADVVFYSRLWADVGISIRGIGLAC